MRKILSTNLLIACLALTACSDHVGTIVTDQVGPEAPINDPDTGVSNPGDPIASGGETTNGGGTSGGAGGGTSGGGTSGGGTGTGGGSQGGGGGGSTGGGGNPGGEPGGGGSGSAPVPEPGTLLLVGSGLAGIGASLLRRRRRREDVA